MSSPTIEHPCGRMTAGRHCLTSTGPRSNLDERSPAVADATQDRRPVPRRVRFEVLRRDNYTCRYCGAQAPDVPLTVDHVIPIALGGGDDPTNLVTACEECNSGKASTSPDEHVVAQAIEHEQKWRESLSWAAQEWRIRNGAQAEKQRYLHDQFESSWNIWKNADTGEVVPLGTDWRSSVTAWTEGGLTIDDLTEMIPSVMRYEHVQTTYWQFYCGRVWRAMKEIQAIASDRMGR